MEDAVGGGDVAERLSVDRRPADVLDVEGLLDEVEEGRLLLQERVAVVLEADADAGAKGPESGQKKSQAEEGGFSYLRIAGYQLPTGCVPAVCNLLLCPQPRDGYQSRLFFPVQITGGMARNWNGNIRVLGENWYAFSWATDPGLRLVEMLLIHINGLRK